VPLGQHEPIAIGVDGVRLGDAGREDRGDQIGDGQAGADVTDVSALGLLEDDPADVAGQQVGVDRDASCDSVRGAARRTAAKLAGPAIMSLPCATA
jgi:hypothetical protein